jgi:hypothetical protein
VESLEEQVNKTKQNKTKQNKTETKQNKTKQKQNKTKQKQNKTKQKQNKTERKSTCIGVRSATFQPPPSSDETEMVCIKLAWRIQKQKKWMTSM